MRMYRIMGILAMLAVTVFAGVDEARLVPGDYVTIRGIFPFGGNLLFSGHAWYQSNGLLTLKEDGTIGPLAAFSREYGLFPTKFVRNNDSFVFLHNDERGPAPWWDWQLWMSDGTAPGTRKIMREPVRSPIFFKDWVYFVGDSLGLGSELWRVDASGKVELVVDLFPGSQSSYPSNLAIYKDKLLFWANDGRYGYEPHFYDPQTKAVTLLKDISTQFGPCELNDSTCNPILTMYTDNDYATVPFVWNGILYFMCSGDEGFEPYRSDGTAAGTYRLIDLNKGGPNSFDPFQKQGWKVFNNELYFVGDNGSTGYELWKTRGTAETTVLVKDIQPGIHSSNPRHFIEYKGYLYFQAETGPSGSIDSVGTELWRTDGTAAGTQLFYEFNKNPAYYKKECGSYPEEFIIHNDRLYFSAAQYASDGVFTESIWSTDGTVAGTVRVKLLNETVWDGGHGDNYMTVFNNELYFSSVNRALSTIYKIVPDMPPRFESTPITEAQVNEYYSYEAIASDPNTNPMQLTVVKKPTWMSFSTTGGHALLTGYPASGDVGNHQVILRVDANGENALQSFTVNVTAGTLQRSVVVRMGSGADDAMEFQNGQCDPTLDRLELGNKTVALRFKLNVPADAVVRSASLQFASCWQHTPRAVSVQICGERSVDAAPLTDGVFDIATRVYSTYTTTGGRSGYRGTAARVTWNIPLWNNNEMSAAQKTPDISAIINELISQPNWKSGNEIVLCILHDSFTKAGLRAASYETDPARAPRLQLEFTTGQEPVKPLMVEYLGGNTPPQLMYGGFVEGALQCNDRQPTRTFTAIPSQLRGMSYLLTARDDKHGVNANTIYYQLELPVPMRVYALVDARSTSIVPAWIAADGWGATGLRVTGDATPYLAYYKDFNAGEVSLKRQNFNNSNGISYVFDAAGNTTPLTVSVQNYYGDQTYPTVEQGFNEGSLQVNDRPVALWTGVPAQLKGLNYLLFSRSDKYAPPAENSAVYRLSLSRTATVYCLIDNRSGDTNPAWLAADGWSATSWKLMGEDAPYSVYSKLYPAGIVELKREVGVATNGTGYVFK